MHMDVLYPTPFQPQRVTSSEECMQKAVHATDKRFVALRQKPYQKITYGWKLAQAQPRSLHEKEEIQRLQIDSFSRKRP